MKWLVSTKAFLTVSLIMLIGGILIDIMVWLGLVAQDEPPLVVHLSTFALIFAGYGNVITALINREVKRK